MYLLELLNHRASASKLGSLVLTCVLASGLGLSGCSNDSSEGKDDEDSAEPSDEEDGEDSQEEDGSEDDGGSEDEGSQEDGETEGDESGGDEESDKDSAGDEQDPDEEDSKDKDPDEEDPDKEDPDKEDEPGEGEGGEDKPKRDCEKIQWGSGGVKKGEVVPRDDQKGYLDKDGDGKLETEETDVGMCQLHLTGKRCGLVITGFSGWKACGPAFRSVGQAKDKLTEAGVAVYANYSRLSLSQGMTTVIDGYLGGFANLFAVKTGIRFPYAPFSFLIDLKTMQVMETGQVSVAKAISACQALPE